MHKSKILFFTSFPPPLTGQTLTTQFLYDGISDYLHLKKLNTSNKSILRRASGDFNFIVLLKTIPNLFRLIYSILFWKPNFLYTVYSSSKIGLLRDYLYIRVAKFLSPKLTVVAHVHSGNYGIDSNKKYLDKLLKRTDKIIFLNEKLNHINDVIQPSQVEIVPNSISSELLFSDSEVTNKINERTKYKTLNLLFLGNFIKEKGYLDVIRSIMFLDNSIDVKLFLIGAWKNDKDKEECELIINENKLNSKIEIVGPVYDRSLLKKQFHQTDILILPSYYKIEAFPISILEALNSGTPVIGSKHAAIPEIIKDGKNGYLVDIKSPKQIAEKIELLSAREHWKKNALNSRLDYLENYKEDIIIEKFKKVFK